MGEVAVWRKANGGSKGDAHGRWDVDPKANQFWIGQKVTFADCTVPKVCTLQVLSVDHKRYGDGMYFHFDKSALDAILGRSSWHNEKLELAMAKRFRSGELKEADPREMRMDDMSHLKTRSHQTGQLVTKSRLLIAKLNYKQFSFSHFHVCVYV